MNSLVSATQLSEDDPESAKRTRPDEPTLKELLILVSVCYALYVVLISLLGNYSGLVRIFGDNKAYVMIATAIRRWDFTSLRTWQLWGLPYAMVAFSFVSRISFLSALLVISVCSSFITLILSKRLWGGWVAGFFAVVSRDWMERSLLGGAEPLFLVLVFGSFLAARRHCWKMAALLAALSTTVRPMGIFALAALGITLLFSRQYKNLAIAVLIGLFIGGLYAVPLRLYKGSSLEQVKDYSLADGSGGKPITYPFLALMHPPTLGPVVGWQDVNAGKETGLNLAAAAVWVGFVLFAVVAMFFNQAFREFARSHIAEVVFCSLYIGLLFTYNSPWARTAFPRYAIPVIPFLILACDRWIPKNQRVLWAFGLASAALSAFSTLGVTHSFDIVRRAL